MTSGGLLLRNNMDVPSDIVAKMEHFCVFQERCVYDVRKKLALMPCSVNQREEIIRRLCEDGFLNEERYAETFVRSKIRDQWGKLKIRQALFAKQVDEELTNQLLDSIDLGEYEAMLRAVAIKWRKQHASDADNRTKLVRYLLSRGFAMSDILTAIQDEKGWLSE